MESKRPISIKICGITKADQAKEIAKMGIEAIGIIGVEKSPRFAKEDKRRAIFSLLEALTPNLERVWVLTNPTDFQISSALKGSGRPSVIQLHGEESPERCRSLRKKFPETKWWKAIRIKSAEDIDKAKRFQSDVDAILLDAWVKELSGGTGKRIPIEWLIRTRFEIPWWLAGGISPDWAPKVLSKVTPFGLDASSCLEISPGIKDLERTKELIRKVKETQLQE